MPSHFQAVVRPGVRPNLRLPIQMKVTFEQDFSGRSRMSAQEACEELEAAKEAEIAATQVQVESTTRVPADTDCLAAAPQTGNASSLEGAPKLRGQTCMVRGGSRQRPKTGNASSLEGAPT